MFPDFLVVGAQKAGTTWLQRNLLAHPQLWMPKEKELHYFDEKIATRGGPIHRLRGDRPADKRWRRQARSRFKRPLKELTFEDVAWDLNYFLRKPNDKWYASLFRGGKGMVAGEATPDYAILDKDTVAHVHRLMPEARIVFMMRNPIERPWSALDMRSRVRGEPLEEMKEKKLFRRFDARGPRLRTDYLGTLETWGSFYPEDRIFVGFLEDVHLFPGELLEGLYGFLGVDPSFRPPVPERKVHSGDQSTIPTRFAAYLGGTYREQLEGLDDRFGGYASFWLYCAERLANDPPPEEHLPYPLWGSSLWQEWEESREISAQSGPLSTVIRSAP